MSRLLNPRGSTMRLHHYLLFVALGTALFAFDTPARAQEPIPIGPPDRNGREPFTLVRGLRELPDGRVLVTDWIESRLVVIDLEAGSQRDLGRVGAGPNEFRLPGALVAMPGDSTLLVDVGNARLTVLDPNLRFARSMSDRAHGERYAMNPRAVDHRGILYFGVSPFALSARAIRADSVPIARWAPGFPAVDMTPNVLIKTSTPRPPTRSTSMGLPYVPFAKQDAWAATEDGWVAVVRSVPYRVEWYGPDGERLTGDSIAYQRRPVTMEDRRDHVRAFLASSMQSGREEGGGMGLVPAELQTPQQIDRMARDGTFAAEFPPFQPDGVWVSGTKLWVERSLPSDFLPTFDVFDRIGVRQHIFSFERGRRIVGFGERHVYAVVADQFDLLTLERYAIPEGGR